MTASTLFSDIDQAVILGLASYQPLADLRSGLRGGSGEGANFVAGPVPQIQEREDGESFYDVHEKDCPCLFVSGTEVSPLESTDVSYEVEVTAVLPSMTLGARLTDAQLDSFAETLGQGLQTGRTLDRTSLPDRLFDTGLSALLQKYRPTSLGIEGTSYQHRIVATLQFELTPRVLQG